MKGARNSDSETHVKKLNLTSKTDIRQTSQYYLFCNTVAAISVRTNRLDWMVGWSIEHLSVAMIIWDCPLPLWGTCFSPKIHFKSQTFSMQKRTLYTPSLLENSRGVLHLLPWKYPGALEISRTWKKPGPLEFSRAPGKIQVSWKFPGGTLFHIGQAVCEREITNHSCTWPPCSISASGSHLAGHLDSLWPRNSVFTHQRSLSSSWSWSGLSLGCGSALVSILPNPASPPWTPY